MEAPSTGRSLNNDPLSLSHTCGLIEQIIDSIAFPRYHVFRTDAKILF